MKASCEFWCGDSICSPLNAVSQVNKTKNANGMIVGAYKEELNVFDKFVKYWCPTTVTNIYHVCSLSMHGRVYLLSVQLGSYPIYYPYRSATISTIGYNCIPHMSLIFLKRFVVVLKSPFRKPSISTYCTGLPTTGVSWILYFLWLSKTSRLEYVFFLFVHILRYVKKAI